MYKRFLFSFCAAILCFSLMITRLAGLATQSALLSAADQQSAAVLQVAQTRGVIYDRLMRPLTCIETEQIAAVLPCNQAADALMRRAPAGERQALLEKLTGMRPFLWQVDSGDIYAKGIDVFPVAKRYLDEQPAVHLIGQLDAATGQGASGLELAYDSLLSAAGGSLQMRYFTDALGRGIPNSPPERIDTGYNSGAGLVLTLDRDLQQLTERAAVPLERGAVVIMDPQTGDLLASASVPAFHPNNPAGDMNDPDLPFLNRAFCAYSVGSTFKLLVAAAALEQGYPPSRSFDCQGAIEVLDQTFHCHNLNGHGVLDMQGALEHCSNPYFISLALELGGAPLLYKAQQLGFGTAFEAAPGFRSYSGTLPTARELLAPAATANFGFGQGALTATPVQIACLVSAIANGGGAITPRLVAGSTVDGTSLTSPTAVYSPRPVFLPEAAEQVRRMMVSVVEEGSGKNAKPQRGGAGGKTASAQTGQYLDGEEVVHAWFAGFYPAEEPRYTIVVFCEGGDSGGDRACPVFKEIADGIAALGL